MTLFRSVMPRSGSSKNRLDIDYGQDSAPNVDETQKKIRCGRHRREFP